MRPLSSLSPRRQAPRSAQQLNGGGAIAAVTVARALSSTSNTPIRATARAALVNGPAYRAYLAYAAYVDFGMSMRLGRKKKIDRYRVLRQNVAIPMIQNDREFPFAQLSMSPHGIRADNPINNFPVTSVSPCLPRSTT